MTTHARALSRFAQDDEAILRRVLEESAREAGGVADDAGAAAAESDS